VWARENVYARESMCVVEYRVAKTCWMILKSLRILSGSFAGNDLQLKAFYGSMPSCRCMCIVFVCQREVVVRTRRMHGGHTYSCVYVHAMMCA